MMLAGLGYGVISAWDAEAALRMASCHPEIRLVITDSMTSMDKVGCFEETLKKTLPGTRLLLISGYAFEPLESLDKIIKTPFLPKPLSCESLAHKIRELLATA
jgi:DNA-binding NtrC family response regulator